MTTVIPPENSYVALLSFAEGFRTTTPPDFKSCLQCLLAASSLQIDVRSSLKTHLQIVKIILNHTDNINTAQSYCEKAWQLSQNIPAPDELRLETCYLMATIHEKNFKYNYARQILRKANEESSASQFVYWHCKILFQMAKLHAIDREYHLAANILSSGAEYAAMANAQYTRILFLLSKGMMLMIDRRLNEVHSVLSLAGQLVEAWQGNLPQKESLKVFFLVLQVSHHLNAGQVKSVKAPLKLLQQSIQSITTYTGADDLQNSNPPGNQGDEFFWMAKEHMCVLVYLVTVMHSMQAGFMDKAQKYTEKALGQIDKLKTINDHPLLHTFQLLLLEHISMCRLVMGNRTLAIKETIQALQICWNDPKLKTRHKPLINTLLGLYAMSMNCIEDAEKQFVTVLNSNPPISQEIRILVSLNLSIVFLKMGKEQELNELLSQFNPDSLPSVSQSLKAACYYVFGLNAFFHGRYNDAKRFLRETLKLANAEDLNRLTSCSLVLLGHIFYSLGNSRESLNMVQPAWQLANRIPDIHVQLWTTALLKDLYHLCNDPQRVDEISQSHQTFSTNLYNDYYQASQLQEHEYIRWLGLD